MHAPHVASGGRYPALRTVAILYLFAAVIVVFVLVAVVSEQNRRDDQSDDFRDRCQDFGEC